MPIKLKELRKHKKLSQIDLAKYMNVQQSTISNWESEKTEIDNESLDKLAKYFGVSVDYILGRDTPSPINQSFSENEMYSYSVVGTISAGYDGLANEEYTGEDIIVPPHLIKSHNPNDYFVLQIKGNSMFPLLEDGDKVLIRRCSTVESGKIAAVGYNGDEATIKKVEYIQGEDWMRLIPRNPEYPVKTIRDSDLDQCRIYGEVVYLFRDKIGF
ncbi:LexA family protein [Anaerocaecibacter muris]|uniref:LexA family protein n=1 Tax=Anaerocaecibacter muris TaxID=2941513 RepID=UPI003F690CE2